MFEGGKPNNLCKLPSPLCNTALHVVQNSASYPSDQNKVVNSILPGTTRKILNREGSYVGSLKFKSGR